MFSQNIHCGYMLEQPHRGSSNEYTQCMFWIKNKKIRFTPVNHSFPIKKKVGFKGVYISLTCFSDDYDQNI